MVGVLLPALSHVRRAQPYRVGIGATYLSEPASEVPPPSYDESVQCCSAGPPWTSGGALGKGCSEPPLKRQATFGEGSERIHARPWSRLAHASTDDEVEVEVWKRGDSELAGVTLRSDIQGRAYVHAVERNSPAADVIGPYDELVEVAGRRLLDSKPAHLASEILRSAPIGRLTIRKRPCPEAAVRAARLLQDWLRTLHARSLGVERRVIFKASPDLVLGLSLSPDFRRHSVVNAIQRGSAAARALDVGDLITHIDGIACSAPADAARRLRVASGIVEIRVRRTLDAAALAATLHDAEAEQDAAAAGPQEEAIANAPTPP